MTFCHRPVEGRWQGDPHGGLSEEHDLRYRSRSVCVEFLLKVELPEV
jgi:hypothetical protein